MQMVAPGSAFGLHEPKNEHPFSRVEPRTSQPGFHFVTPSVNALGL